MSKPLYKDSDFVRAGDFRLPSAAKKRHAYGIYTASEYGRIVHSMSFRRLQGKMQLFPSDESPLLRNRLTHSLEVADIAARITNKLNHQWARTTENSHRKIDVSIVTTAALAHDLGHPPFGHSGEVALNDFMSGHGGYEGNAQTLRIISRLENRFTTNSTASLTLDDVYRDPLGLNLMFRTLAGVLKRDQLVPDYHGDKRPTKGYYEQESWLVSAIKDSVLYGDKNKIDVPFYTIECNIMDIADDIAYSTYDLEDCFISGVLDPLDIISISPHILDCIRDNVNNSLSKDNPKIPKDKLLSADEVRIILFKVFDSIVRFANATDKVKPYNLNSMTDRTSYIAMTNWEGNLIAKSSLYRRRFTETLIRGAIDSVYIDRWNEDEPALTRVKLSTEYRLIIEALKHLNYWKVIESRSLQVYNKRAKQIISGICDILMQDGLLKLLPEEAKYHWYDFRHNGNHKFNYNTKKLELIESFGNTKQQKRFKKRMICDYVSSLTDEEAEHLFKRLTSEDRFSLFQIQS